MYVRIVLWKFCIIINPVLFPLNSFQLMMYYFFGCKYISQYMPPTQDCIEICTVHKPKTITGRKIYGWYHLKNMTGKSIAKNFVQMLTLINQSLSILLTMSCSLFIPTKHFNTILPHSELTSREDGVSWEEADPPGALLIFTMVNIYLFLFLSWSFVSSQSINSLSFSSSNNCFLHRFVREQYLFVIDIRYGSPYIALVIFPLFGSFETGKSWFCAVMNAFNSSLLHFAIILWCMFFSIFSYLSSFPIIQHIFNLHSSFRMSLVCNTAILSAAFFLSFTRISSNLSGEFFVIYELTWIPLLNLLPQFFSKMICLLSIK